MQSSMAFNSAYRLTGESIVSDIAYAAKSAQVIQIGERTWYSRARSQNKPGGIPFGYYGDIQQCDDYLPAEPYFKIIGEDLKEGRRYMRRVSQAGAILATMTSLLWYGFYMSGGLGFSTAVAAGAYCGNVVDDLMDNFSEIQHRSVSKVSTVPPKWKNIKFITDMMIQAAMETYEKYPSLMEYHWGGAHRISLVGSLAGSAAAMLTGSPMIGQQCMNYAIGMLMKEGWVRTGWAGQEVQDHLGLAYSCSFRMEEGGLIEFRGCNSPYTSYTAGHGAGAIGACLSACLGRGRAYVCNPVVKVAFADPDLKFDFREPRLAIAKAALRQFMPAGERDLIVPSH
jgi:methyl-coenzyme M reductase alpha subunit